MLCSDGVWEFLSFGDYQAGRKEKQACFEALLWLEYSYEESSKYCDAAEKKTTYRLSQIRLEQFRADVFGSVVGDYRATKMVESTIKTNRHRMEADTARAFCALQDYRAKTGENRNTLLIAKNAPAK